ncbi:hypothetical protein G9M56_10685 [Listeria monocytogenes]|nr:hypothetical protein G9M56_10685 [Listeria monocytogenes]KAG3960717.1 hypothetical protein G9M30_11425 [Listeria monocytogenes]KAG3988987.1 hypothetical protein G9M20_09825 [Listeria monocytogenes]KAG4008045.1 hypothetical protein G9M13_11420 [Listeria monocytogenes]
MIRKIFIGILSFTILIQTVIVSNFNVVYATTEEHKQEAIKLEKKSTNNNIICIKGAVKDKVKSIILCKILYNVLPVSH